MQDIRAEVQAEAVLGTSSVAGLALWPVLATAAIAAHSRVLS